MRSCEVVCGVAGKAQGQVVAAAAGALGSQGALWASSSCSLSFGLTPSPRPPPPAGHLLSGPR